MLCQTLAHTWLRLGLAAFPQQVLLLTPVRGPAWGPSRLGVLFRIPALACHLTEVLIMHTQVPFVPEDVICTAFVVELSAW